ncbi:MAG: PQQ-dependent sugar dehydrogenase [Myxococcota bacterium]
MRRSFSRAALMVVLALMWTPMASSQFLLVPNFVGETDLYNGPGLTALTLLPDGTVLVCEKQGRLLRLAPDGAGGFSAPTTLLDLRPDVVTTGESGLLGITLSPTYTRDRYVYILYSTATEVRVERLTLNAAGTSIVTQTLLLGGLPATGTIHKAGDLEFRPGEPDNLYIALGDNGFPVRSNDLTLYEGKILRVDRNTGLGLASNPFYRAGVDALDSVRARIWIRGLRNPFRIGFHPDPGVPAADAIYISENGDSTDRMAWATAGTDGAWSAAGDSGGFLSPPDPDFRVLETYSPSVAPTNLLIASSGPFSNGGRPVAYLATWMQGMRRYALSGTDLDTTSLIPGDPALGEFAISFGNFRPADTEFGPDGALYWVQSLAGSAPTAGILGRIRWIGGDPPVASFTTTPDPATGDVPLEVRFRDTSTDPDGTIASREWDFGDGTTSTARNPTHTYTDPGDYTVTLSVLDDTGLPGTALADVQAVRGFVVELRGEIQDGRTVPGTAYEGDSVLRLFRSDGVTPVAFRGGAGPDENELAVSGSSLDALVNVALTDEILVAELSADGFVAARAARAVDPAELTNRVEIDFVLSDRAVRGQVVDTRGRPIVVDIGVRRDGAPYALANGRDFLEGGPAATGVPHRVESDVDGFYYLPLRDVANYGLELARDVGTDRFIPSTAVVEVATVRVDRDLVVGLIDGGLECDDISGVGVTEEVDYAEQVQPIWSALCVGCHRPGSDNGFGLNLTPDESYDDLLRIVSAEVPGLRLVTPFEPDASYLMEKIACADPQSGERMRPDSAMTFEEQALVRDWIAQGARPSMDDPPPDLGPGDMGVDLGTPPDAGMGDEDAGPGDDAGMANDAGPAPDAGSDAGADRDAGSEGSLGLTASCSAGGASGAGLLAWLLLGGLARRRRSRD